LTGHPQTQHPEMLLLDGTAMLFRAFFSGYRVQSVGGVEVGAVVMVTRQLQGIVTRQRPDRVAVLFDPGHRTFRHEIDTSYKAQRPSSPKELYPQFDLVQVAAVQLGLACFCVRGFEADDLMATMAMMARGGGYKTRLVTADKDIYQLVCDEAPPIVQEDPKTGRRFTESAVRRRVGVLPSQMVDYLSLVGDSCDNIPGIRGIGPKTAVALLEHFGSLDAIYDNLDKLTDLPLRGSSGLARKLEAGQKDALKARSLVVLRRDVELGLTAEEVFNVTRWLGPRGHTADRFFGRLGEPGALRRMRRAADVWFAA
jgi:DNA polymerase-1